MSFFKGNPTYLVLLSLVIFLLIPLIAMQYTTHINWDVVDFCIMAILLISMGSLLVLVIKIIPLKYRKFVVSVIVLGFLTIWVELAVGVLPVWGD